MEELIEIVCLEEILKRLTYLIKICEFDSIDEIQKLTETALSVVSKLDYIRTHLGEVSDEEDYEDTEYEDDDEEEYEF